MAISRLESLFERYVQRSCTKEEEEELMSLIEKPVNREEMLRLIGQTIPALSPGIDMPEQASASALEAIFQSESVRLIPAQDKITPERHISWWLAAAAAVAALFFFGWYWNNRPQKNKEPVLAKKENRLELPPGGNKAILTLADGRKIVLDSAANGLIGRQGNVKIVKRASGELAYSSPAGKTEAIVYNEMTTPRGGEYKLSLPDGTRVWLNANSSIRYPTAFVTATREVEISGEVYFEVTRNSLMPFVVKVSREKAGKNDMEIKVLGTHFNVMAYPDEPDITTTLLEGKVSLSNGAGKVMLQPGQQARLASDKTDFEVQNKDGDEAVAWTTGFFQFENRTIYSIMRQLSRWYDVDISYGVKDYKRLFGGRIGRDLDLPAVLSLLEANNIHFKIEGRKITVLP
jgi:transmembrane sensor